MIREIKTFISVARRGSFAAAGQEVGLSPSAVSAQIRTLEDGLGVKLFERSGRAISLNPAGQRAVPLAEEMLQLYSRMGTPDADNDFRGALRIGAIGTAQTGILPQVLVALKDRAPFIEASVVPGVSLHLLSLVDSGDLDLAIMITPPFALPKDLRAEVIAREPFVLITPPDVEGDDPLMLLQDHPFIRYDRNSFGGRSVTRFLREHRLQVRQTLELDELDAIVKMVGSGLGVALVPMAGVWLENSSAVRMLPLGERVFFREIVLLSRYAHREAPLFRLFRTCVMDAMASLRPAHPSIDVGE
ncbi:MULTISPECIES: LysR family transcriptional regulator [unclassified Pseudomonas]|uniref:LysR family transcriptional regulator n=1 Tax=unclassified Pseudomonas TaxID=196821 RepID=UPI000D3C95FF|nr:MULTISPECIES: LysR family transcriptional regulator [unclassified Pseudomonas]RAU40319.1 LysR family transcriptional regulator [Pseudomonas sp. RIT 409]RAU55524.1 LysR family transcriptional regulator [Pseudomonas sp. RIT 412]